MHSVHINKQVFYKILCKCVIISINNVSFMKNSVDFFLFAQNKFTLNEMI